VLILHHISSTSTKHEPQPASRRVDRPVVGLNCIHPRVRENIAMENAHEFWLKQKISAQAGYFFMPLMGSMSSYHQNKFIETQKNQDII